MTLFNANIVLENEVITGSIIIDGGRITKVTAERLDGIDCRGLFIGPGFIDTHSHGGGDKWFFEDPKAAADFHLGHGTTSMLASLWRNAGKDGYEKAVGKIVKVIESGQAPNLIGIHMEGAVHR